MKKASKRLEGSLKGASRRLEGSFQGGLKGARLQVGWKASRGLERGFKEASRRLEGSLKPYQGEGGFERLEGGLKEA